MVRETIKRVNRSSLTPLFYFLPQTALAATIIIAVFGLLDIATFKKMWAYNKTDAMSLLVTFLAVLGADRPDLQHLILICSAINFIDGSALETLDNLREDLEVVGVRLYLAEVKGPVMDRLQKIGFIQRLRSDRIFLSTHQAMLALGCS